MYRPVLAIAFMLAMAGSLPTMAVAAPCKDARGKFVKCPPAPRAPVRCKNARGHFARCGTPGAKPV